MCCLEFEYSTKHSLNLLSASQFKLKSSTEAELKSTSFYDSEGRYCIAVEVAGECFSEEYACGELAGAIVGGIGVGRGGVHNSFMGVGGMDGLCL